MTAEHNTTDILGPLASEINDDGVVSFEFDYGQTVAARIGRNRSAICRFEFIDRNGRLRRGAVVDGIVSEEPSS